MVQRSWVLVCVMAMSACSGKVTVMSYNVCNLFDTQVDGTEYDGKGADPETYRKKCGVVAGAIRASCPGGPDIVALQEVENLGVIQALRDGWLRGLGYRYYLATGGPRTAVRVGFLSRLPIVEARVHAPLSTGADPQRSILEIRCRAGGLTLHLLNNHWKSRLGGGAATEGERLRSARLVADRVRVIAAVDPNAEVVVLGDLNEDLGQGPRPAALGRVTDECVIELTADPVVLRGAPPPGGLRLYDPWLEPGAPAGSYAYGGEWSRPDHVLLSAGLMDDRGMRYRPGSFRVVAPAFLVDDSTGLPRGALETGERLHPDHLPLLVSLVVADPG